MIIRAGDCGSIWSGSHAGAAGHAKAAAGSGPTATARRAAAGYVGEHAQEADA